MRILFVGPGSNQKYGGGFFYATHRRLVAGFTRAGHFVYPYSDRDTADYAFGVRALGRRLANTRLVDIARDLQPDLLVLLLSYLITPDTIRRLREVVPHLKVAAISIDDIGHERPATQFRYLLACADIGFATTGGATLARFATERPVAFIPNPIDVSIDAGEAYATPREERQHDVLFACHQPEVDPRWRFVADLRQRLADLPLRWGLYGNFIDKPLKGDAYLRALAASAIGLSLNRRDGDLYASDRMAHFLGNGLLLATPRASGYGAHFGDDEMLLFDRLDDLAAGIERALGRGEPWRTMAAAGRRRALATMEATSVCRFIADLTLGRSPAADWPFAAHIFTDRRPSAVTPPHSATAHGSA
ncbi:MAG: glycosyltransferase [Hyphomicrobiaceae bacterium]|nr:glycosyltransferase [Hyphomicrobiaceae bacterium]